jgi:hypothetical protein
MGGLVGQQLVSPPQVGGQHTFVKPLQVLGADGRLRVIQPENISAYNDRFVARQAGLGAGSATNQARRAANQAQRQASRSPGGWNIGGAVDSTEALMAERDRLQQQLQTADEAMAQEIMAQIMEINKELEMEARNFGMAGGGVASLRGGGAPWSRGNPRFRPIRQQAPQAPMGPPARLSRPGWGSPGLDIPGGG